MESAARNGVKERAVHGRTIPKKRGGESDEQTQQQERVNAPPWLHRVLSGLLVVAVILLGGCQRLQRGRQIRAYGDLQYVMAKIEDIKEVEHRLPRPAELEGLVGADRLVDRWGHEILYGVYQEEGRERYVLASRGADGKLDLASLDSYLAARPEDVSYDFARDLVVVDGKFVLAAGL